MILSKMVPGSVCRIKNLNAEDRVGQRLLDLGVYPGLDLTVLRNAPLEDPMEIEINGFFLSLRHDEAKFVEVEPR